VGVSARTARRHYERAGYSTARPYSDLTDDELDAIIGKIIPHHPLSGSVLIGGHVTALGYKVSHLRIQQSVRRVDPIGVMMRYGCLPSYAEFDLITL
jgi:hypothetical protein